MDGVEGGELRARWSLDESDVALVGNKTGSTRLGFAILLKFFEAEGRFPTDRGDVPAEVIGFLAGQIGVEYSAIIDYDWSGSSWKRHRAQIRRRFGFRACSQPDDVEVLVDWLVAGPLADGLREPQLLPLAAGWCRERRVEPPAASTMSRVVRQAQHRFDGELTGLVVARLGAAAAVLDRIVGPDGRAEFALVRADPGGVSLASVLSEIDKLNVLRSVGLPAGVFDGVSDKVIGAWRARLKVETPSLLAAHPRPVRLTMLAAWWRSRETEIVDALVDLLLATVHKITAHATQRAKLARGGAATRWSAPVDGRVGRHRRGQRVPGSSGVSGVLAGDCAGLRVRPGELRPLLGRAWHRYRRGGADGRVRLDRLAIGSTPEPGQGGGDHDAAGFGAGVGEPPGCGGAGVLRASGDGRGQAGQPGAGASSRSRSATQGAWSAWSSRSGPCSSGWAVGAPAAAPAGVARSRGCVGVPHRSGHASRPGDRVVDGVRRVTRRGGSRVAACRCRSRAPDGAGGGQGRPGTKGAGRRSVLRRTGGLSACRASHGPPHARVLLGAAGPDGGSGDD